MNAKTFLQLIFILVVLSINRLNAEKAKEAFLRSTSGIQGWYKRISSRESVEDREGHREGDRDNLPWQFLLLSKFLPSSSDETGGPLVPPGREYPHLKLLRRLKEITSRCVDRCNLLLMRWIRTHRKSFFFALKGVGLALVSVWFINRVISWYKGIAEYEILIDKIDYKYQSYGCNLNNVGSWLLSNINQTAVDTYGYKHIFKSVENVLDIPCFPQSMNDYAIRVGKDVVPIIYNVDAKIRSHERIVPVGSEPKQIKPKNRKIENNDRSMNYKITTTADIEEQYVMDDLVKSILLIQAKQTDAILRYTRFQVLNALNTCEDLLSLWKSKVVLKTQTFRLPLPRFFLKKVSGIGRKIRVKPLRQLQELFTNFNVGKISSEFKLNRFIRPRDSTIRETNSNDEKKKALFTQEDMDQSTFSILAIRNHTKSIPISKSVLRVEYPVGDTNLDLYPDLTKVNSYTNQLTNSSNSNSSSYNTSIQIQYSQTFPRYMLKTELEGGMIKTNDTSILDATENNSFSTSEDAAGEEVKDDGSVYSLLRGLNAREKVLFLEEIQEELYDIAGRIQEHLNLLELIDRNLVSNYKAAATMSQRQHLDNHQNDNNPRQEEERSSDKMILYTMSRWQHSKLVATDADPEKPIINSNNLMESIKKDTFSSYQSSWDALDHWIRISSQLCQESLKLIALDKHSQNSYYSTSYSSGSIRDGSSSSDSSYEKTQTVALEKDKADIEPKKNETSNIFTAWFMQNSKELTTPFSAATVTSGDNINLSSKDSLISTSESVALTPYELQLNTKNNLEIIRYQWRVSGIMLRDLSKAPNLFENHLDSSGLKPKSKYRFLKYLRLRNVFRVAFWGSVFAGVFEVTKRSEDFIEWSKVISKNMKDFMSRRIVTPAVSIVNDVVFNNRMSLTDKLALEDAQRSLQVMLNDFLKEYRPKLSESERRKIAAGMNMTPISMEYETELKRPMRNLVSGRIARLVLIQLQFVKKELLVAMQAIDELFNANQVNLQLLAVTPAVLSIIMLQIFLRATITTIRSSSKGRFIESTWAVQRDLRSGMRQLEKLLSLSDSYNSQKDDLTIVERGKLISILFRLQNLLVMHSSRFDDISLRLLQEDLREIAAPQLSVAQRLALVERILRVYPFFQPTRKLWPGGL